MMSRSLLFALCASPSPVRVSRRQSSSLPEPAREAGSSVTGAFEGWFKNPDGTFSLLLGYYNRNRNQEVDLPIGPNNRIEPGGPDRGQPTHFMPGRGWGLFAVKVPADFGDNKITWTLVANGKTTVIPASLKPDYEISPLDRSGRGKHAAGSPLRGTGASVQGPQGLIAERAAKVGAPLTLTVWVSDDAKFTTSSGVKPATLGPPVTVRWILYRGSLGASKSPTKGRQWKRSRVWIRAFLSVARQPPRRRSANLANTCCTSWPTTIPAKAAAASSAAGRTGQVKVSVHR